MLNRQEAHFMVEYLFVIVLDCANLAKITIEIAKKHRHLAFNAAVPEGLAQTTKVSIVKFTDFDYDQTRTTSAQWLFIANDVGWADLLTLFELNFATVKIIQFTIELIKLISKSIAAVNRCFQGIATGFVSATVLVHLGASMVESHLEASKAQFATARTFVESIIDYFEDCLDFINFTVSFIMDLVDYLVRFIEVSIRTTGVTTAIRLALAFVATAGLTVDR
jgi:hypothetical protein